MDIINYMDTYEIPENIVMNKEIYPIYFSKISDLNKEREMLMNTQKYETIMKNERVDNEDQYSYSMYQVFSELFEQKIKIIESK